MSKTRSNPRGRRYVKAVFEMPAQVADEAAGILVAGGALGCAVQGVQHGALHNGKTIRLEAFFRRLSAARLKALTRSLSQARMLAPKVRDHRPQKVIDPGWATSWRTRFEPFNVGRQFLILPPWKRRGSEPGRIAIVIDPGQAFGTGHHPTTAGALRALEGLCAGRHFKRGLDVGSGSGILTIAMARMNVGEVVGIDIDQIALENARKNLRLNGVSGRVRFSSAPIARLQRRFDLIVANILSSVLVALAPEMKRLLAPDGRLVVGGVLRRQTADVAARYAPQLRLVETRHERGWATMVFAR